MRSSSLVRAWQSRVAVLCIAGLVSACGGGGGGGGTLTPPTPPPTSPPPTQPPSGNVTISGTVQFQRPTLSGSGLNYNVLESLPVRGATVEVIRSSDNVVLATTLTDASGRYSADVAATTLFVRTKAQLVSTTAGASFDFEVRDNTRSSALYALDSATATPSASTTINLLAGVTVSGQALGTGDRPAGPFAILDMLWRAKELIQGANPTALPALDVYWSIENSADQPSTGDCANRPNPVTGELGTTFYLNGNIPATAACPAVPAGIYVLGEYASDSDEFDPSVIAHEFGHYYEDKLSRSESMGGPHGLADRADFRLTYSEGWGNAFSGMVLDNSVYRDTFSAAGALSFAFNMESDGNPFSGLEGWFSEASVGELLWDVFDPANEATDQVALGFGPIDSMMRGPMRNSAALSSIYVAFEGLMDANGAAAAGLGQLLIGEAIGGRGDFGVGETNNAGEDPATLNLLPIYQPLTLGVTTSVVSSNRFSATGSSASYASYNRAGGRRYLLFSAPVSGSVDVTVAGPVGSDPDFQVFRNGRVVCQGFADSRPTGREQRLCSGLASGQHVLEVYECSNLGFPCSDESPRGNTPLAVTVTQQ